MVRNTALWRRLAAAFAVPAAALLACWCAYSGRMPDCVFYRLTGLYCPGCGSGRAIAALLHGQFTDAFRWNPLLFLMGIPAGVIFLHEYIRYIFPQLRLRPLVSPQPVVIGCVVLIAAYWILRNIPALSFLAPGV
jgi:hypothetical protein